MASSCLTISIPETFGLSHALTCQMGSVMWSIIRITSALSMATLKDLNRYSSRSERPQIPVQITIPSKTIDDLSAYIYKAILVVKVWAFLQAQFRIILRYKNTLKCSFVLFFSPHLVKSHSDVKILYTKINNLKKTGMAQIMSSRTTETVMLI